MSGDSGGCNASVTGEEQPACMRGPLLPTPSSIFLPSDQQPSCRMLPLWLWRVDHPSLVTVPHISPAWTKALQTHSCTSLVENPDQPARSSEENLFPHLSLCLEPTAFLGPLPFATSTGISAPSQRRQPIVIHFLLVFLCSPLPSLKPL